jgi:uncharacterized membrane protein
LLAALLGVTCFLVTRFGNVPINGIMRSWSPTSPPIDWLQKLHRWDVFNSIRTIAAIGTFLCVSFAAQLTIGARSPAFPGASSERATKQK